VSVRSRTILVGLVALLFAAPNVDARVVRLRIVDREVLLDGRRFGLAGAYEKLSGRVDFALDPESAANAMVVDLPLAPKNAEGEVEFEADFFLIKPVDPSRGNGVIFYEAGNRGRKRILQTFQGARTPRAPPRSEMGASCSRDSPFCGWAGSGTCQKVACAWRCPSRLKEALPSAGWCGGTSSVSVGRRRAWPIGGIAPIPSSTRRAPRFK
jgi:hypothetical protein